MTAFDLGGVSAAKPSRLWLPPLGGLAIAAVVAALVCPLPHVHTLSLTEIAYASLKSVAAVSLANAVGVWIVGTYRCGMSRRFLRRLVLRTSIDSVWLAPLVPLVQENSVWVLAVAAMLTGSSARSLHFLQPREEYDHRNEFSDASVYPFKFSPNESPIWFRRQICSAGAALCAQTGILLGLAGYAFPAVLLAGFSSAVWTWSYLRESSEIVPRLSIPARSSSQITVAVTLALLFTAGGLMRYLAHPYSPGGIGLASRFRWTHQVASADRREAQIVKKAKNGDHDESPAEEKTSEFVARHAATNFDDVPEGSVLASKNEDSGIILLPKKQAYTKLVAPTAASGNGLLKNGRRANPLLIPFNGVYWFFKAPDLRPPGTSREVRGSPELLDIHSTDRRPLSMEAHEHLGSLLSLDCCSRIQIEIRNTDVYQETVSLELILIDSSAAGHPSQSLGTMVVRSKRAWKPYEKPSPVNETLNFPIPVKPSIHRFDTVKIVFRLEAFRADDGAKVAIDHFVLVPRGL